MEPLSRGSCKPTRHGLPSGFCPCAITLPPRFTTNESSPCSASTAESRSAIHPFAMPPTSTAACGSASCAQDPPGSPASLTRSARQSTCVSARSTSARSGTVPSWKFHSRTAEPTVTSNRPSLSAQYPMAARSSSAVSSWTATRLPAAAFSREMSECGSVRESRRSNARLAPRAASNAGAHCAASA